MGEINIEPTPINAPDQSGQYIDNVKRLRSGDGSFKLEQGALELRDSSGNIVVILDANG